VQTVWNDAGSGQAAVADITGTSTFTYAGSALYLPSGSSLAVSLNNFQGPAALVNLDTNGNIDITGNGGTAKVLSLGLVGPSTSFFSNTSSPAAATEFLNGQTTNNLPPGSGSSELPEQPAAPDGSFLTATLNQMRTAQPTLLAPLPAGVTDARFYRVFVDGLTTGMHLEAASSGMPTASLSANPTSITAGQSSTLSWRSTNATSCTGGGFSTNGAISGSALVTPSTTTAYSLSCSGNGGTASASATVSVASPTPTASLSANPTSITAGQSSTLSWSSTNATSCTGGGFSTGDATSGSAVVAPSATTTYTVSCSGNGGTASASATVSVALATPTASLSANPRSITAGQSSTLSWSSTNATSCTGGGFSTGGALSGSAVVTPSVTTTYTVSCSGGGGTASASATVTVSGKPCHGNKCKLTGAR
jgi:hypothetical protein